MKKIMTTLVFSLFSPLMMADSLPISPVDTIAFQISAKQWVSTQTALLTVTINATLNNANLVKARADIMTQLNSIAAGEWHLTQFDRSQDNSGLDKLFVEAQIRLPQKELTDIYQHAKTISKPGITYAISSIEFKPSLDEIQAIKSQLRESLYAQVNQELARINKMYTEQHYTVNRLYIIDGDVLPQARQFQQKQITAMVMSTAPAADLSVSNELIMSAMVEAGSTRQGSLSADK